MQADGSFLSHVIRRKRVSEQQSALPGQRYGFPSTWLGLTPLSSTTMETRTRPSTTATRLRQKMRGCLPAPLLVSQQLIADQCWWVGGLSALSGIRGRMKVTNSMVSCAVGHRAAICSEQWIPLFDPKRTAKQQRSAFRTSLWLFLSDGGRVLTSTHMSISVASL